MNDFKLCTGFVLAYLYDAFPIPISLDSHSIQRKIERSGLVEKQTDPSMLSENLGLETALLSQQWAVQFLEDENLIRNVTREKNRLQYELNPASVSIFNLTKAGKGDYTLSLHGLSMLEKMCNNANESNIFNLHSAIDIQDTHAIINIISDMMILQKE